MTCCRIWCIPKLSSPKLNSICQSSLTINEIPLSGDKDQQTNLNKNVIVDVEQPRTSSSTHTDKEPQSKQKETINIYRSKSPNSRAQIQQSHNNAPINSKSTIPCPFLSRRGWCIKEHNCDFKHPEQSKNSSSAHTDKASTSKPKETINMHYRNRTPNSRLQTQKPLNTNTHNNAQINSKSTTPCPFLSRQGWCIKENNCDFKHPEPLYLNKPSNKVSKYRIRCPFLYRRGYCLKRDQCDFLHDIPSVQTPVMNQNGCMYPGPFLFRYQRPMAPNLPRFRRNFFPNFPTTTWSNHPGLKPLMDSPTYPPRLRW